MEEETDMKRLVLGIALMIPVQAPIQVGLSNLRGPAPAS